ncbi:nitrate reductase associated protein [Caulobacter vibrioides]|nr:nitrate reductase associated protein [Caulobacter vibrioides]
MMACFEASATPEAARNMTIEVGLFAFERDFSGSLRCIPMIVRFKLDRVGVKLTLRQWSQLGRAERERLVLQACDAPDEAAAYRASLIADLFARTDQQPDVFEPDPAPAWSCREAVAESVATWCAGLGLAPPQAARWAQLSALQRFTLTKLSRPGHDNENFIAAMTEFGLMGQAFE